MINAKIDLLTIWVIFFVASIAEIPLWLKILSYSIGIVVGITALIRFYWDYKDREKENTKTKSNS